jgi:hypothetical protein
MFKLNKSMNLKYSKTFIASNPVTWPILTTVSNNKKIARIPYSIAQAFILLNRFMHFKISVRINTRKTCIIINWHIRNSNTLSKFSHNHMIPHFIFIKTFKHINNYHNNMSRMLKTWRKHTHTLFLPSVEA